MSGGLSLAAALDEFLAASVAVWREIDRLDAEPEGYHPTRMSVDLRKRERAAWERYRDLLSSEPDLRSLPWRTGRHVGRTVYAMLGAGPSDDDPLIGVMDTRELAVEACAAHNRGVNAEGKPGTANPSGVSS